MFALMVLKMMMLMWQAQPGLLRPLPVLALAVALEPVPGQERLQLLLVP